MTGEHEQQTPAGGHWRIATELPPDVFSVLRKPNKAINPVTIVATVDPDGKPRTAPFGSLRAANPRLLRLACNRYHDTFSNICRNGQVSVAVLAQPNIAVSILGRARIVRKEMEIAEHFVILEIDIEEVKNDMMRRGIIKNGIVFTPPEDLKGFYEGAIAEIEAMQPA
jgi:hypothetical protein